MLASLSPHGVCHIEASPVWTLGTAPGRRADRVRQRRAERNAYRRVSRMAVSGVEAAQCRPGAPGPVRRFRNAKRRRQASTRFYSHMSKLKVLSFVGADPIHQTLGPGHRLRRCARTCAPRRRRASAARILHTHPHVPYMQPTRRSCSICPYSCSAQLLAAPGCRSRKISWRRDMATAMVIPCACPAKPPRCPRACRNAYRVSTI